MGWYEERTLSSRTCFSRLTCTWWSMLKQVLFGSPFFWQAVCFTIMKKGTSSVMTLALDASVFVKVCVCSGGLFLLDSSAFQTVCMRNKNDILHISSMPMEIWIQPSVGIGNSETYPQMVGRRKHFSAFLLYPSSSIVQYLPITFRKDPYKLYQPKHAHISRFRLLVCLDVDKDDVRLVGADNTRDGLGISTILLIFVCLGHSRHCAN